MLRNRPRGTSLNRVRARARQNQKLETKLSSYVMAASAAGVGVLALTQSAHANVMYTPANQTISPRSNFALDLNGDGITDFTLENFYYVCVPSCSGGDSNRVRRHRNSFARSLYFGTLIVQGAQAGNGAAGLGRAVAAMRPQRPIGSRDTFQSSGLMAFQAAGSAHSSSGNWRGVNNLYLGLKFSISGRTHYGWARLNVALTTPAGWTATLTGYAYETVANRPLFSGQTHGPDIRPASFVPTTPLPATLGSLAQGASGLVAWRREEDMPFATA
jgi:hypothetical protein